MALTKLFTITKTYQNKQDYKDTIKKQEVYPNAYFQIVFVNGNKNRMRIDIQVFSDSTKQEKVASAIRFFTPSVADSSTNFIQQGYEYLKTLPEFADAVDC